MLKSEEEIKELIREELRKQGYGVNGDTAEPHERVKDQVFIRKWRKNLEGWERCIGRGILSLLGLALLGLIALWLKLKQIL